MDVRYAMTGGVKGPMTGEIEERPLVGQMQVGRRVDDHQAWGRRRWINATLFPRLSRRSSMAKGLKPNLG